MNKRKRRRTVNNVKQETPIVSLPNKWNDEELEKLYLSIMENGHKNLKEIMKNIPYRSEANIKSVLRTLYDSAIRLDKHPNLDAWIERSERESCTNAPWKDCLQIAQIIKYLSIQGLVENHPSPERCQGVNFLEAYRLIYQSLLGYPIQPVSEATADFVLETIRELVKEVRKEKDSIHNVSEFLKKNPALNSVEANSKNTSSKQNLNNLALQNYAKKPIKVYQKKKLNIPVSTDVNPLKIVIEEKDILKSNTCGSKDFSLRIEGEKETILNVSVPVAMKPDIEKEEKNLLQSCTYNPFKIQEKWLQEPLFNNLLQKLQ